MGYMHTHNGISFNHEKEGNPAICDNRDGLHLGHYAKPNTEKTNTAWYHLYVESLKKVKLLETE